MNLTIVIAAYNEADNIPTLTSRLISAVSTIPECRWRLIYVIEGTDGSLQIAQEFARLQSEIRVIFDEQPSGLGAAFRKGFDAIPLDTDFVVTMDADLNHQPEEIDRLLQRLKQSNADIIIGSRKMPGSKVIGAPVWKRILSDVVNRAMRWSLTTAVADQTSGFRIYRYASFRLLSYENTGFAFLPEILIVAKRLGMVILEEPITFVFRERGYSKMSILATARSYGALLARMVMRRSSPTDTSLLDLSQDVAERRD